MLRAIILETEPKLTESIKWNAPSYALDENDRITFAMYKSGITALILHMGALRKETVNAPPVLTDDHGIVEWKSDIRGVMSFESSEEISNRKDDISDILRRWLAL